MASLGQTLRFTGPVIPPEPIEMGWKDTVRMNPGDIVGAGIGQITRIVMPWDLPRTTRLETMSGTAVSWSTKNTT